MRAYRNTTFARRLLDVQLGHCMRRRDVRAYMDRYLIFSTADAHTTRWPKDTRSGLPQPAAPLSGIKSRRRSTYELARPFDQAE